MWVYAINQTRKTSKSCLISRCFLPLSFAVDKSNILLNPSIETVLELSIISVGRPLDTKVAAAARDLAKVVQVRIDVETEGARVAFDVSVAGADLDIADRVVGAADSSDGQPVLGGSVAVAEDDGRQARDRVVDVGDAVFGSILGGDVVANYIVADTGAPVRVNVDGDSLVAEISSSEGSNCSTEGVASGNDLEAGVSAQGFGDG